MSKATSDPVDGILLLDKPVGITSNAALTRAKHALNVRKAGHTGTLDPLASGLLPLCFGEATKVSAFLLEADKRYLAELTLGLETRSGDREGDCIAENEVPALTREAIERILDSFRGPIEQVPPMHSALKHKGRRLHELARAGIEVAREPRRVIISELTLLDCALPQLTLRVSCSKGTYIRSLAIDIGRAIGCGAHLSALRRERSGPFDIADAVELEDLLAVGCDRARELLLPPDRALKHLPAVMLTPEQALEMSYGRTVDRPELATGEVRMYEDQRFLGIGRIDEYGVLRVRRGFRS